MAENNKKLLFPAIVIIAFTMLIFSLLVFDRPEAPEMAQPDEQSTADMGDAEDSVDAEHDASAAHDEENDESATSDPGSSETVTAYEPTAEHGEELARARGCLGCHSTDGTRLVGPSFQGLYGHEHTLSDGTTVLTDDAYIIESIRDPNAKIAEGFQPNLMPAFGESQLSDEDIQDIIAFIKTLSE